jgi:CBS domain-containing protein
MQSITSHAQRDGMTAGEICTRELDLTDTGESVHTAAHRMLQRNVGTLIVRSPEGKPLGIVTDRDLVLKVLAQGLNADDVTVGEIMTEHPRRVSEDMGLEFTLSLMESGRCRRLLVVNAAGNLVGLVSLDDILLRLANGASLVGKILDKEGPRVLRAT